MRRQNVKRLLAAGLILMTAAVAGAEDFVDGEVLVKCTQELNITGSDPPETGDEELDAVILELGVTEITEIYDFLPTGEVEDPNGKWDNDDWAAVSAAYDYETYYHFLFDSPNYTPVDAAAELEACEIVEFAEPNYLFELESTYPNDPGFQYQWNLHNTGQTGGTADADIDAPEGWDYWPLTFRTAEVAVIDSGADLDHNDLAGNLLPGKNFANPGYPPEDYTGHGSHVTGIITAVTNNGLGVAGTGFNKIKVRPVKVPTSYYEFKAIEEHLGRAILWAALEGADVENFSWGAPLGSNPIFIHKAIQGAYELGVVMCASKGNRGERNGPGNKHYPSDYKEVIAVTATDDDDVIIAEPKWPWGSNYGPDTEFCAPGAAVYSTWKDGGYAHCGGTSMAAPHLSAACALIQAHYRDVVYPPLDRVANARNILKNSVDDLGAPGWDEYYGWGRLNLDKLMDQIVWDAENRGRGPSAVSRSPIPSDAISQNEGISSLPAAFRMYQSFPNPAAGTATFKFDLAESDGGSRVTLKVYDLSGRCVATVVDVNLAPGRYEKRWDCTNRYGEAVPAGVYVYRLIAGKNVTAGKLVVNSE